MTEGDLWRFECSACNGSTVKFEDPEDDEAPVSCATCGLVFGTLGQVTRQMAANSEGNQDPKAKLRFRKVETRH